MTDRQIPGVLWVALVFLGVATIGKLLAATSVGAIILVDAAVCAALLAGLYLGHKWAYVLTVVIVPVKVIVGVVGGAPAHALVIFVLDCLVLVPVLMSTRYFWGVVCRDAVCGHKNRRDARYCARCGTALVVAEQAGATEAGSRA